MSFDTRSPAGTGVAGLIEWCRRDRVADRLVLAAAAGDPVAIAHLTTSLACPTDLGDPAPAVEIVAVRRPQRLAELADRWHDANGPRATPAELATWRVALRHLAALDRIDLAAALQGPLASEATIVFPESPTPSGPVSWDAYCTAAGRRPMPPEFVRAIARLGIADRSVDVDLLPECSPALWRVLRGRWTDATGLTRRVVEHDACDCDPWDLAVWWEAAVALGQADLLADRLGEQVLARLLTDDRPERWWPPVLAVLTDWVVP